MSFKSLKLEDKESQLYLLTLAEDKNTAITGERKVFNDRFIATRFFRNIATQIDWKQILSQSQPDLSVHRLSDKEVEQHMCALFMDGTLKVYKISGDELPQPQTHQSEAKIVASSQAQQPVRSESLSAYDSEEGTHAVLKNTDNTSTANQDITVAADLINMANGEELLILDDFTLPGPIAFTWTRVYRTSHSKNTGIGHGWTHTGYERLRIEDNDVIFNSEEGREIRFRRPQVGQKCLHLYENMTLLAKDKETFILQQPGKPVKVFTHINSQRYRITQWRHEAYVPARKHGRIFPEQGYALNFYYDNSGNLECIKGNWGRGLVLVRDEFARIIAINQTTTTGAALQPALIRYEYDQHGDLLAVRNAQSHGERYQYENHIIIKRSLATGYSFHFEWDQFNNEARCLKVSGDKEYYTYTFKWDPDGKRSEVTDSRGHTRKYQYNEFGLMTEQTDAQGHVVHRKYNEAGKMLSMTDALGHTTEYLYDEEQRLLRVTDALGGRFRTHYTKNKLTTIIDEANRQWLREYNQRGLLASLTHPNGGVTRFRYNNKGLLIEMIDAAGRSEEFAWNEYAELIRTTDIYGNHMHYRYDAWGRVSEVFFQNKEQEPEQAAEQAIRYEYTAAGYVAKIISGDDEVEFEYNPSGQLIRITDAEERITEYKYEEGLGQPGRRIDPAGNEIQYQYDSERNLTALVNENGDTYKFYYDANYRLIKEVGFDGRIQEYKYNAAGQLIMHQDGDQVQTVYERDALGRLLSRRSRLLTENQQEITEQCKYRYDELGRLLETATAQHYLAFSYDAMGNILRQTSAQLSGKKIKQVLEHEYNLLGQRTRTRLPDGERIDYRFNAQHDLESIDFNDKRIMSFQYDECGRETHRRQGLLETRFEYDAQGRLRRQQAIHSEYKERLVRREYGYDDNGRLEFVDDGGDTSRYLYDILDRLQQVSGRFNEFFTYDAAGSVASITETHTALPGLIKGNRLLVQGPHKFLYDSRGNLVKAANDQHGDQRDYFMFDAQNQLRKYSTHDASQTVNYQYDPLLRRIAKITATGSTHFLWDQHNPVQEQFNNNKKIYIFAPDSFKPLLLIEDNQIYYYHLDHLGAPRELSNAQGHIVWRAAYHAFGAVALKDVDEVENNLRLPGQYYDEESGLHYNRFRYFFPASGQYISQDPLGLAGGLNAYQYATDPINFIDPLGLCREAPATRRQITGLGEYRPASRPLSVLDYQHFAEAGHMADQGSNLLPSIDYFTNDAITGQPDFQLSPSQLDQLSVIGVHTRPSRSAALVLSMRVAHVNFFKQAIPALLVNPNIYFATR